MGGAEYDDFGKLALKTTVRDDYSHQYLEWASDSRLIMITAHRRENLGEPMRNMFRNAGACH